MGNQQSQKEDKVNDPLAATSAMADYLTIRPDQLQQLLIAVQVQRKRRLSRRAFHKAMRIAKIRQEPDQQVLDLLFTMWGTGDRDSLENGNEFIVSLTVLAAKSTLEQVLELALTMSDGYQCQRVEPKRLLSLLTSESNRDMHIPIDVRKTLTFESFHFPGMNTTATYLGDSTFSEEHIQKIVHSVFPRQSTQQRVMSNSLGHPECVKRLQRHPLVVSLSTQSKDEVDGRVRILGTTTSSSLPPSAGISPRSVLRPVIVSPKYSRPLGVYDRTARETDEIFDYQQLDELGRGGADPHGDDDWDQRTDLSSIILKPLAKISVDA